MSSRPAPSDQGHVSTPVNHDLPGHNSSAPVSKHQRASRKQSRSKQATPCKFFATKQGEFQPVFTSLSFLAVSPARSLAAWPGLHLLLHETRTLYSALPYRLARMIFLEEAGGRLSECQSRDTSSVWLISH